MHLDYLFRVFLPYSTCEGCFTISSGARRFGLAQKKALTAKTRINGSLSGMKLKWLAVIYVLFLVLLVFLVDQKQYQFLFRFVRQTPYGDKVGHFVLMGLFSLLLNLALSCRKIRLGAFSLLAGSLIVAVIVTLEELSQIFVRYR